MKNKSTLTQFKALAAAALFTAVPALAQNINIDYGNGFGAPPMVYGGPAAQPGIWNNPVGPAPFALVTTAGAPTGMTINGAATGPFAFADPGTGLNDSTLFDDGLALGGVGAVTNFFIGPFAAGGNFLVFTYAWGPNMPGDYTKVNVVGSPVLPQTVGGVWPGGYVPIRTFAFHTITVAPGGFVQVQLTTMAGTGRVNGFQIVQH